MLTRARKLRRATGQQEAHAAAVSWARRQFAAKAVTRVVAAARIQRCWRAHCNRRVFRYYAGLVRLRETGLAAQVLPLVNAREAQLLDPATRLRVRFRLGGAVWPPDIYYKVHSFIHSFTSLSWPP